MGSAFTIPGGNMGGSQSTMRALSYTSLNAPDCARSAASNSHRRTNPSAALLASSSVA